jgi:hypothetical protein
VLFVVTGGLRGRSKRKRAKAEPDSQPPATKALGAVPPAAASAGVVSRPKAAPVPAKRKGAAPADDDFGEVAAILKRHGIS